MLGNKPLRAESGAGKLDAFCSPFWLHAAGGAMKFSGLDHVESALVSWICFLEADELELCLWVAVSGGS